MDVGKVEGPVEGIAPIMYSSILNKKVIPRPRVVELGAEFIVPEEHAHNWNLLREKIERGDDFSHFLSKDHTVWNKVDFLLICGNIYHLHLTSRRGVGSNKELIFGIFGDEKFYAISFGDHHSVYQISDLYEKAELGWPGKFFRKAEAQSDRGDFDKRMVNDPECHMNLFTPAGKMSGHQRSYLTTLSSGNAEIRNVSLELWNAFENEKRYLIKLEDRLSDKYGYLADQKLAIDLVARRYKIFVGSKFHSYDFSKDVTISGMVSYFFKLTA